MDISIIIANRDHPIELNKTIVSITSDEKLLADNYEIIVVNDGNREDIEKLVGDFAKKNIIIYSIKIAESRGSYFARNRAIEISKGEWLIFFDSGLRINQNWYSLLRPHMSTYEYIVGDVKIEFENNMTLGKKFDYLSAFPMKEYFERNHFGGAGYLAVKRTVFDRIGLFNENVYSGGDGYFGGKVYENGFKQYFFDKAPAYHKARTFKQQFYRNIRLIKGHYDLYLISGKNGENPRVDGQAQDGRWLQAGKTRRHTRRSGMV